MIKQIKICLFVSLGIHCFFPVSLMAEKVSPANIVLKVDEVRNPQLDYTVSVVVTSYKLKGKVKTATYNVKVKGRDKTVVKTLLPESEKGNILLMRERNVWAFFPAASKPLRISLQERLMGEIAIGDIARANFSGDYKASILRIENIKGKKYYVLQLIAVNEEVPYGKAILWVEKETSWPLRAEFYAISGRLLKTCFYQNYRMLAGRLRPTRLIMEDPIVKGQKSVIEYDNVKVAPLPEKYFNKEYMKKFAD